MPSNKQTLHKLVVLLRGIAIITQSTRTLRQYSVGAFLLVNAWNDDVSPSTGWLVGQRALGRQPPPIRGNKQQGEEEFLPAMPILIPFPLADST